MRYVTSYWSELEEAVDREDYQDVFDPPHSLPNTCSTKTTYFHIN